jgi:hypothetical protein
VEWNGQAVDVPLKVEQAKVDPPVSFRRDVMPVFLKSGCNSGGCHGASRGKDGFRLSLFGYDPEGDHFRLTHEMVGRRINLALPEESMIITKNIGTAPHTGGKVFAKDSEIAKTLLRWLEAGAPNDPPGVDGKPTAPECTSIELLPKGLLLEGSGQRFRTTVRAHYADGTDRDITSMALFLTSNEGSAKIEKDGTIVTGQRGEAFVMARFATHTVGSQVIVIPKDLQYEWPQVSEANWVDGLVHNKLRALRMLPSGTCDDETFLRRANIDITGALPTSAEVKQFVADTDAQKRGKKVDELLNRKEFVDMWALKWSELLQIRTDNNNQGSYKAVLGYYTWVRDQLEKNVPLNQVAAQLISATGSNLENPAANYYQLEQDPLKLAEDTAQAFFGIRIQCAQCHNHPFDRWTMDDYRGFVAFFTQIGRKNGEDPRERIIFSSGSGESKHPLGDRVIPPKFLGGEAPDAKARTAASCLRTGLPHRIIRTSRGTSRTWCGPSTWAAEVLNRWTMSGSPIPRRILSCWRRSVRKSWNTITISEGSSATSCTSRTYQLTTRPNETNELDDRNFAKATIRRMRAEVMLDCITQVTETKDKYRGLPAGARAVEIADGKTSNYFLPTFGRATRETICSAKKWVRRSLRRCISSTVRRSSRRSAKGRWCRS